MSDTEEAPPVPKHIEIILRDYDGELPSYHSSLRSSASLPDGKDQLAVDARDVGDDRSISVRSVDTHEANLLFQDFDGVHFQEGTASVSGEEADELLAPDQPQDGGKGMMPHGNLTYYPAPVPRMINLPQRLSHCPPPSQRDHRRSQVLQSLDPGPAEVTRRLSALDGPVAPDGVPGQRTSVARPKSMDRLSRLPPQLRASEFFDHPTLPHEVTVRDGSALETLESILDASMSAPVTAFTDHPIAGRDGAGVYRKEPSHRSRPSTASLGPNVRSSTYLGEGDGASPSRRSVGNLGPANHSRMSLATSNGLGPEGSHSPGSRGSATREEMEAASHASRHGGLTPSPGQPGESPFAEADDDAAARAGHETGQEYFGRPSRYSQPTTLLAELQLRKEHQRQRNKTAATAFPNGMQSTLLELDAIAEAQKRSRKQRHVTLAWEESRAHDANANEDRDEDVPLAMLMPHPSPSRQDPDGSSGPSPRLDVQDDPATQLRGHSPVRGAAERKEPGGARLSQHWSRLEVPGLEREHGAVPSAGQGSLMAEQMARLNVRGDGGRRRPVRSNSAYFADDLLSRFGNEAFRTEGGERRPEPEATLLEPQRRAHGHSGAGAGAREAPRHQARPLPARQETPQWSRPAPHPSRPPAMGARPASSSPYHVPSLGYPQMPPQFPPMTSYAQWRSTQGAEAYFNMFGTLRPGMTLGPPTVTWPSWAGPPNRYAHAPMWSMSSPHLAGDPRFGQAAPGPMNMPNFAGGPVPPGYPPDQVPPAMPSVQDDLIHQWRQRVQS